MTEAELDAMLLGKPKEEPIPEADLDAILLGKSQEAKPTDYLRVVGEGVLDYAGDALSTVGSVLDYPMAPVREAVGGAAEYAKDRASNVAKNAVNIYQGNPIESYEGKTLGDIGQGIVTPLVEGPSKARSWAKIFEDLGVPSEGGPAVPLGVEQLMTDQEKEMAPKYQPAQIAGALADLAQPAAMAKVPKVIPNIINREKQAERAIGLTSSAIEKGLTAPSSSTANVENIVNYAKDSGIIKPFSSTKQIFDRAAAKAEQAGKKIGEIVAKANSQIENWISKATPNEVKAYLGSGFNVDKVGAKMAQELADSLEGGSNVKSALNNLKEWVERHDVPMKGRPDLETLQKWKMNVGNSIKDFSKNPGKQPGKEAAYKKILEYIDKGIESEISFAEKYLKGEDLKKFKDLKREYSLSTKIRDSAGKKFASERSSASKSSNLKDILLDPIYGSRVQSTLSTIPEKIIPRGPIANQVRIGATLPPTPYEQQEMINRDQNLTPTQKAKMLREIQR